MSEYPKTLFRPGGPEIFYGRHYERCVVRDAAEEEQKLAANWILKPLEAPEQEPEEPKAEKPKAAETPAPKAPAKPKKAVQKKAKRK